MATAVAATAAAAATSATVVAEHDLSSSISQRSTGFTDRDTTWVFTCSTCKDPVPVSAVGVVEKWSSGQRLHIRCVKPQCGTIVCYSSSSDTVYGNVFAANTQMQLSFHASSVASFDSMGPNLCSPRNSLSEYEPPTKPPPFSHADFEAHGFDRLRRRSSSWSSTTSDSRLPTRTTSPEPVPSILSGKRNSTARPDSIGPLTPTDPIRQRDSLISQSSVLSDSPRNSGDHNLIKLAAKNRSRVSLQSKPSPTQGRRSIDTISPADALAEANDVSVSAAGFSFSHRPRQLSQSLAAPHSGNARLPTPVPEEGGTALDPAAMETVFQRPVPYADAGTSTEEAIPRRVSRRSTARPENSVQQEQHRKSQRGIKGFGCFVKRGIKRLPSRLQGGIIGLIRIQKVLRCWEHGGEKVSGKGLEVVLPEPEPGHNQGEETRNITTTDATSQVAPSPVPALVPASPVVASSPPSPPPPEEPTPPAAPSPQPQFPGPAEEAFPAATMGEELDRRQIDVSATQELGDVVFTMMSGAWAEPGSSVVVAMSVPAQM